jgi:menaquinone-specific isochorismate synthase
MPYDDWEIMLNDAIGRIRAGELKKVVLSRVAEARYDQPVNIDAALRYLAQHYAECYRFMFEPRPYRAFYGATPELLVAVQGDQVRSMGLAGSIKRGATPEEDAERGQELLDSKKDRHEHQLVVDRLRERLTPLTSDLHIGETGLYKLSNIQHIYTPVHGTLAQPQGILPMVEALHPTPALGGEPREIALPLISQLEPVPRGWYAAPVGWIDNRLDGQFGVAIRSAVAQKNRVWMYAGAGIVGDSDPAKEWDETALKFTPMLKAHNSVLSDA